MSRSGYCCEKDGVWIDRMEAREMAVDELECLQERVRWLEDENARLRAALDAIERAVKGVVR